MALGLLMGFLCGVLSGLGIGGGSILMLWLTAALAFDQRTAQGINLLYFLPTALSSVFVHVRRRSVDFHAAVPAAVTGVITACIGAFLAQRIDTGILRRLFGVFLLITGGTELYRALKRSPEKAAGSLPNGLIPSLRPTRLPDAGPKRPK